MGGGFTIAIFGLLGACFGFLVAPALASLFLARKRERVKAFWEEGLRAYKIELAKDPLFRPSVKEMPRRSALAAWRNVARRRFFDGTLERERAVFLMEVGIVSAEELSNSRLERTLESEDARYSAPVPLGRRLLWAILCGGFSGLLSTAGNPLAFGLAAVAAGLLVVTAYMDSAAHIAPFELAWALYPVAFAYSLVRGGVACLWGAVACVLVVWATVAVAILLARALGRPDPIGVGDARLLPACGLLCGPDGGLAALVLLASLPLLAIGAAKLSGREIGLKTRIAMGPYIAVACMGGILIPVVGA